MVKEIYCYISLFDRTVLIQTEDESLQETIPVERFVETITDFCRSRHIGTVHLLGVLEYVARYKREIYEYSISQYGHNVVEVKINE